MIKILLQYYEIIADLHQGLIAKRNNTRSTTETEISCVSFSNASRLKTGDYRIDAVQKGDSAAALKLLTLSAEQGATDSQKRLAFMYEEGKGGAKDYVKAHMWLIMAAIDGIR